MKKLTVALIALFAVNAIAAAPPRLVVAGNSTYRTAMMLEDDGTLTEPETVNFSRCLVGPDGSAKVVINPGGADVIRGLTAAACIGDDFALVNLPPSGVKATSLIRYDNDALGEHSEYVIHPIGALEGDAVVILPGAFVHDAEEDITITTFPTVAGTPLMFRLIDATSDGNPDVIEKCVVNPPLAQCVIDAEGVFHIEVQLGTGLPAPYQCWDLDTLTPRECSEYGAIYGLGSNGTQGTVRVHEFPIE